MNPDAGEKDGATGIAFNPGRYIEPLEYSHPGLIGLEAVVVPVLVSQVSRVEIHRFGGMCACVCKRRTNAQTYV